MLDLDPIKARVAGASPGPWIYEVDEPLPDKLNDIKWRVRSPARAFTVLGRALPPSDPDGEFVAHARADIPALVAEVERLQRVAQAATAWRHSTTPAEEAALVGAVDALEGEVA